MPQSMLVISCFKQKINPQSNREPPLPGWQGTIEPEPPPQGDAWIYGMFSGSQR